MHRARSRLLTISLVLAAGAAFLASRAFAAAPVLTVPGSQTVNEGTLLTFNVSATDADGQPLVFRASALPAGSTFHDNHNNTATFTWTPNFTQAGPYGPTFIADDTFGGVDAKGVIITVTNVNQAPVLDPIGDRDVERGTSLGIFVSGSDADDDPLTFSTQNLPAWATFTDFGGGMAMLQLTPPGARP